MSARKPASFWQEKRNTVVILQKYCRPKTRRQHGSSFGIFRLGKAAQVPAIRIIEQPMLLTKSMINRQGYKFVSIFAKNGPSNLLLVHVLVAESTRSLM